MADRKVNLQPESGQQAASLQTEMTPDRSVSSPSDRRTFLQRGIAVAATLSGAAPAVVHAGNAMSADRPEWMRQPGEPFTPYGKPSRHEQHIHRRISANRAVPGNGVSMTPLEDLEGFITPNGLHFERHHNGVPLIDPAHHTLVIDGLVDKPIQFSLEDLRRYPMESRLVFIECGGNSNTGWHQEPIQKPVGSIHGMVSCAEWTGVPLPLLLKEAGLQDSAQWTVAEGADAFAMQVSIPLDKTLDDCLIALYQNGEPIRPENGYPMRLIVPGWEGVLHVKWLRRLHLVKRPVMSRNETARYTELMPSGKARQFTFVMEPKSVITSPTSGQYLPGPGPVEIKGLAWSGRGSIRRVDISTDGGRSWKEARLAEPVLPRCLTRFRLAWNWNGNAAILQSRVTDETGAVQPTRAALLAERGRHAYYHYHAIDSWAVAEDGEVSHVHV